MLVSSTFYAVGNRLQVQAKLDDGTSGPGRSGEESRCRKKSP